MAGSEQEETGRAKEDSAQEPAQNAMLLLCFGKEGTIRTLER